MEIRFIASEGLKVTLQAVRAEAPFGFIEPCPFQVGDFIAYSGPAGLAMRISQRAYVPESEGKPARWLLWVEKAPHPVAAEPPQG